MKATFQLLRTGWSVAAALLLAATLAGCSSAFVDHIPTALGGLPKDVPARSATALPYPAVHDMPPPRQDRAMSASESGRLRQELKGTREKVAAPAPSPTADGATAGAARNP
jgi:hypothetical protein